MHVCLIVHCLATSSYIQTTNHDKVVASVVAQREVITYYLVINWGPLDHAPHEAHDQNYYIYVQCMCA